MHLAEKGTCEERSRSHKDRGKQGQKHRFISISRTLAGLQEVVRADLLPFSCKLIHSLLIIHQHTQRNETLTKKQDFICCDVVE